MQDSSKILTSLGVHHALIGGLAVGAHGYPRTTKDVDFLVDESAYTRSESGVLAMRAGLPFQAHGLAVDSLAIRDDEAFLKVAITEAEMSEESLSHRWRH